MHIKSIQKTTLIDYPGLVASTIFTGGCNFRCDYCYNNQLVYEPDQLPDISEEEILSFLESRKDLLEGVAITGGEPTIHHGLPSFLKKIQNIGLKVKLDTNGYLPNALEKLIDLKVVDYIAMDIKASFPKYAEVCGVNIDNKNIMKTVEIIKNSAVEYEFRTTVWQHFLTEVDFLEIFEMIAGANNYYLQNSYEIPDSENSNLYKPMSKKDISLVLEIGKKYVKNIQLRGNWY